MNSENLFFDLLFILLVKNNCNTVLFAFSKAKIKEKSET